MFASKVLCVSRRAAVSRCRFFSTTPDRIFKTDLAKIISDEHDISPSKANRIVTTMLDTIVEVRKFDIHGWTLSPDHDFPHLAARHFPSS